MAPPHPRSARPARWRAPIRGPAFFMLSGCAPRRTRQSAMTLRKLSKNEISFFHLLHRAGTGAGKTPPWTCRYAGGCWRKTSVNFEQKTMKRANPKREIGKYKTKSCLVVCTTDRRGGSRSGPSHPATGFMTDSRWSGRNAIGNRSISLLRHEKVSEGGEQNV